MVSKNKASPITKGKYVGIRVRQIDDPDYFNIKLDESELSQNEMICNILFHEFPKWDKDKEKIEKERKLLELLVAIFIDLGLKNYKIPEILQTVIPDIVDRIHSNEIIPELIEEMI